MSNRHIHDSNCEGGHHARPLAVAWRAALVLAVVALLVFAIQESLPTYDDGVKPSSTNAEDARQIDWESLPDSIVAWVEVPGTNIDEPIAQAEPSWPNRYLHEDALGKGAYGTPYIDCDCRPESPFVVVYGHHMSDGSVFADFANYCNQAYAEKHQTIYVYTRSDNGRHEFKVKAVDIVNACSETLRTIFNGDKDLVSYLRESIARSDLILDDGPITNEQVWTFVTCSYQTSNSRTVIYIGTSLQSNFTIS